MTRRDISMERYGWAVDCYIGYTAEDSEYLCQRLSAIGCAGEALAEAYVHFMEGGEDCGLTYSNVRDRRSVVAIGRSQDNASMVNTIGHELLHVVAHMCEADGVDMTDEEACYMMGELCEKVFEEIRNV